MDTTQQSIKWQGECPHCNNIVTVARNLNWDAPSTICGGCGHAYIVETDPDTGKRVFVAIDSSELATEPQSEIFKSNEVPYHRLCIGTATLGTIRMEWHQARIGQTIPVNWSMTTVMEHMGGYYPMGFLVADAQNLIVTRAVMGGFEWLLLYEDDVLPPHNAFLRINEYMNEKKYPVVSGLYYIKARPTEPLVFRGRGNSTYTNWKRGDLVWADGVPTGFLLIHMSIINAMWEDCEPYTVKNVPVRRMFDFPRDQWQDPESMSFRSVMGTSDLDWCTRVIEGGYFKKAGWPNFQRRKYPFLVDTGIWCVHIDPNGEMYP